MSCLRHAFVKHTREINHHDNLLILSKQPRSDRPASAPVPLNSNDPLLIPPPPLLLANSLLLPKALSS